MVAGAIEGYGCCDRAGNGQRKGVGALGWTRVSDGVCDVNAVWCTLGSPSAVRLPRRGGWGKGGVGWWKL